MNRLLLFAVLLSLNSCHALDRVESNFKDLLRRWNELSRSEQEKLAGEITASWILFLQKLNSNEEQRKKVASVGKVLRAIKDELSSDISPRFLSISVGFAVGVLVDFTLYHISTTLERKAHEIFDHIRV